MRVLPIVIVVALAGSAAADGTSLQGLHVTAETAMKRAHESRDPAAFEVCGQAFVEVANTARTEKVIEVVPDAMYNAAVCFEQARSVSAAIMLYMRLEAEFPTHRLVPHAVMRLARIQHTLAHFDDAATAMESYAAKYAAERDAGEALENAFMLRMALGDDEAARKNAERWLKAYGAKRPSEAAEVALVLARRVRDHGTPDAAMVAHRDWLKKYGGRAERHHVVAAYAVLGELAWDASCKMKDVANDGLCLGRAKPSRLERCGKPPVVVIARDAALVAEAKKALQQATRAAETSGDTFLNLRADHARLSLADMRLEAALATEMPAPLTDATGRLTPASQKAVAAWLQGWQKGLADARRAYEDLVRSKNLRVSVLAAGRIAFLSQHAADTLASAPLPTIPKPKLDAIRGAYCDELARFAEPLDKLAQDAADACLSVAAQGNVVEETAFCVQIRDRHDPAGADGGERLPIAASPRIRDVEPEIRYRPPGTFTPSPP
jgi:tetratricopeptide (TPR) repeat protein